MFRTPLIALCITTALIAFSCTEKVTMPLVSGEQIPGSDYVVDMGEGVTLQMVWIPGGTFEMGSEVGEWDWGAPAPVHTVELDGFWMGKYEVTNAQYRRFKDYYKGWTYKTGDPLDDDEQPVPAMVWKYANPFCEWLSKGAGQTYSLPSEAQWEYACRAGSTTEYYWGDEWDLEFGNTKGDEDGFRVSAPVGSFKPNAFGLYDMAGNQWELCADAFAGYSASVEAVRNPLNKDTVIQDLLPEWVVRGGSWQDPPDRCRSAWRMGAYGCDNYVNMGFRVVCIPRK